MDKRVEELRLELVQLEHKARYEEIIQLSQIYSNDTDPDMRVMALLGLKTVAFEKGDSPGARHYMSETMTLAREQGSPEILVEALCAAGYLRSHEFSYDAEMTALAQEALTVAQAQKYERGIVLATICLASSLTRTGSKSEVRRQLENAVTQAQKMHDYELEATACSTLANFFTITRKFELATKYNLRALSISRYTGDDVSRCVLLTNLAGAIFSRPYQFRTYDQAVAYNEEALALARELGYRYGELGALFGMSWTYLIAHDGEKALKSLEELNTLAETYEATFFKKPTLMRIGMAHLYLRNYEAADASLRRRIALADAAQYDMEDVYAYYHLGNVRYRWGRYKDAIGSWRYGLMLHKERKNRNAYYLSLVSFYITCVLCYVHMGMRRIPRVVIQ